MQKGIWSESGDVQAVIRTNKKCKEKNYRQARLENIKIHGALGCCQYSWGEYYHFT